MSKLIDITGQRFGLLLALEPSSELATNKSKSWLCRCDCGVIKTFRSSDLRYQKVTSCGCEKDRKTSERFRKHGKSNTRLYQVWTAMKQRCQNPKNKDYPNYGGRGISISPDWISDFENFYSWAAANGYKQGLTIERVDPNGNYEPANCCWITNEEQSNNRRNSIKYDYQGKPLTIRELSEEIGINYHTLRDYLRNKKLSVDEVIKLKKPNRKG